MVGYEALIDFIIKRGATHVAGDFIEIGAFLGGGTLKLARLARSLGKKVWVIDVFDPGFDATRNTGGVEMRELYAAALRRASQEKVFRAVIRPVQPWINVIKEDSRTVQLPAGVRFAFGFIDGNHDPAYVHSDFRLVWGQLSPGGWLGLHDYGGDLPQTTGAIDSLISEHQHEIQTVARIPDKTAIFLQKIGTASGS
jgi:hypothetical protein